MQTLNYGISILSKLKSRKIQYGWYDIVHNKKIYPNSKEWNTPGYFNSYCKVLKPDEFWKYKIGSCWDISLWEYTELIKFYNCNYIYLENTNIRVSHAAVCYSEYNKWYWFEFSWLKYEGIHGPFKNFKMALDIIKEKFKKEYNNITFFNPNVDVKKILSADIITDDHFLNCCYSKI
jgi:hypothetical protein